jgi:uncharacterized protein involved in tolerance to divalent cations
MPNNGVRRKLICVKESCALQLKQKIEEVLEELHPYEVPELLFLPIRDGLQRYLFWMGDELR